MDDGGKYKPQHDFVSKFWVGSTADNLIWNTVSLDTNQTPSIMVTVDLANLWRIALIGAYS
tara:strand:- start:416 stop:598 length:183 start_codon:yes stop_codon:yes gene_type:complete